MLANVWLWGGSRHTADHNGMAPRRGRIQRIATSSSGRLRQLLVAAISRIAAASEAIRVNGHPLPDKTSNAWLICGSKPAGSAVRQDGYERGSSMRQQAAEVQPFGCGTQAATSGMTRSSTL